MASSVQCTTRLITTQKKLNKKCSNYETNQCDVMKLSHKQLCSGHMNFYLVILISNLHIHRNGTKGLRKTYRLLGLKWMEEEGNWWISFILVCGTEL